MNSAGFKDKSFDKWVKETYQQHGEILEQMCKSHDPLERTIAIRISNIGGLQTHNIGKRGTN